MFELLFELKMQASNVQFIRSVDTDATIAIETKRNIWAVFRKLGERSQEILINNMQHIIYNSLRYI